MNMSAGEKIKIILSRSKMTMGELADATGQTRQNLSNKMSRDNFSEKDLLKMAEALNCEMEIVFTLPDGTKI